MSLTDLYHNIRATILRAVVKVLDDGGPEQHVAVVLHAGQERTSVPVHHPFGFSSSVPVDGAVTHVIQNGGDPSDLFALPPSNPGAARMGGLKEGESIHYDAAGQRLHFQNGRVTAIDATAGINITLQGEPLLTMSEAGSVFHGDLFVKGNVWAGFDVMAGKVSLQGHAHSGVQAGGADTGKPGGDGNPPDDPKPENAYTPQPRPPWRNPDGSFVGKRGTNDSIRIMEPSDSPWSAAHAFAAEVAAYMASLPTPVEKIGSTVRQSAKGGAPFEQILYSDNTKVNIRPDTSSSSKTPDGWYTVDVNNNDDTRQDLGTKSFKLKFPPLP